VNSQPPPFPNQIGLIQEPISDPLADLTTETPETKEGEPVNPESFFDSLELNESFYDSLELNEDHAPDAKIPVLPHSHREAEMSKQWEYKVLTQKDKWFSGKFDPAKLEEAMNAYAAQGWRVVGVTTASIPGLGGNRDELIVVLER
jgi:hypothetical protein